MRNSLFILFLLALLNGAPVTAVAMEAGISVIVNEEPISQMQINDRVKLIMISSGMPQTQEVYEKVAPQVVQMLIEEKLKMQEAKRFDITVSDAEINGGIATIAQQNKLTAEQFEQIIKAQNIPRRTLEDQVRSQIAWGKVVQSQLRPKIEISDSDIDDELSRIKGKVPAGQALPERAQVLSKIGMDRLNRMQYRYLLDLKAEAFIENRG